MISTVLGTITAIGLSKSRKVVKELLLSINNIPILNPDIVTAIGLMLLFSSLGFRKGYLTMLLAHIAFCTPYVITSVYPKVRSLDPNLANAAMDLGATPVQALTKVNRSDDKGWDFCRCACLHLPCPLMILLFRILCQEMV